MWVPWQSLSAQADLLLLGYSSRVVPKPIEWNEKVVVTGYWFLDADPGWQPSDELVQFLGAGPPPVYIGFGSMSSAHPEHLSHLVQEALERSHQRGVLLTGWGALCQEPSSEQLYTVASVPHDWLFPQMAAVVHHGGAGTTGASLRAGVPSIIISFLPEQAFWGAQVFQLGAGPCPLTHRTLTAPHVAQAIEQAVHDTSLREHAAQLGAQIRAEQGVVQAVEVFEQVVVHSGIKRHAKKGSS
jgi:UDP:flavonoid glycosyltransferase YjiC (YdhE family)